MKIFQGAIEGMICLILIAIAVWWSWFCFSNGYRLGHNGVDNRLMNWLITSVMNEETTPKKTTESDKEKPPENDIEAWLKRFKLPTDLTLPTD
jgi:hypothetical protein